MTLDVPFVFPLSVPEREPAQAARPLTFQDAIDIWIARWLRVRRKDLCQRYQCDPRRLYEIWEETRFPGARAEAVALFRLRFPGIVDRIDYGVHRRIPKAVSPDQLSLFGESDHP